MATGANIGPPLRREDDSRISETTETPGGRPWWQRSPLNTTYELRQINPDGIPTGNGWQKACRRVLPGEVLGDGRDLRTGWIHLLWMCLADSGTASNLPLGRHLERNNDIENLRGIRLIMDLLCIFLIQKDEGGPGYWGITIPEKLRWPPSLTNFRGPLLPGKDMCIRFSFELAKGPCGKHPISLFVLGEMRKPLGPPPHTHPPTPPRNHRVRAPATNGRFPGNRIGYMRSATSHFNHGSRIPPDSSWPATSHPHGELSAVWLYNACIWELPPNLTIAENATIAQLNDRISTRSDESSKFREREADVIKILQEEGRRIKRDDSRERGVSHPFALPTWKPNNGP